MKVIDMQCMPSANFPTVKDEAWMKRLLAYFKSEQATAKSEDEMIRDWKEADAKVVLASISIRNMGWTDFGEIKDRHNYVGHLKKDYPDTVLGAWICIDPDWGWKGLCELERCIKDLGTYGIMVAGAFTGVPANDKLWYPYYDLCNDAKVPIKIFVGGTGMGAGEPGGHGYRLWLDNPIPHVDDVAAQFPELNIVCHHVPWPFHDEMVSVMIHKANVYNELHGWRPRYYPETLKREINGRVQDKVMFGSDYPVWSYQRLYEEWEDGTYKPEVLEKVYYKNAQKLLGLKL